MNIAISIQHPSSVHFFKYIYQALSQKGHNISIYLRQKGVAAELLDAYNMPYKSLVGPSGGSYAQLASNQIRYEVKLYRQINKNDIDIILERVGLAASHVSALTGAVSVGFTDNQRRITHKFTEPFLDIMCTPEGLQENFNTNHISYSGFKELAYLHPKVFEPNYTAVKNAGIDPDSTYSILRIGDFEAHHDIGKSGFNKEYLRKMLDLLNKRGDVYLIGGNNNKDLPSTIDFPPHLLHDILYYANICIADSKTIPTEAAILGTPAYRYNPFPDETNYLNPLENRIGTLNTFKNPERLTTDIEKWVEEGIDIPNKTKVREYIGDKYEVVSEFVVNVVEGI